MKSYRHRQQAPAPDFHKLENILGKHFPQPALDESETVLHKIVFIKLLMLSVTGVTRETQVPIIRSIVYGSRASAQKLASNIELTRSHNVKNLLQHTELNISLRNLCVLLATSGSISHRKTVVPSEAVSHRKMVVPSKANPLLASANLDLVRIEMNIIRRGECDTDYAVIYFPVHNILRIRALSTRFGLRGPLNPTSRYSRFVSKSHTSSTP